MSQPYESLIISRNDTVCDMFLKKEKHPTLKWQPKLPQQRRSQFFINSRLGPFSSQFLFHENKNRKKEKMKITLEQVIENSKMVIPATGEKRLVNHLEKMKKWKKNQVENLFDENDALFKNKENQDDHKIVASSRKHVRKSLQKIINEAKKKEEIKLPVGNLIGTLAVQLISKENIIGKFKNAEVELNPEEND